MHKRSSLGESTEPAASPVAPGRGLPVPPAGGDEGGTGEAPGTGPVPAPRRRPRILVAPVAETGLGPPRPRSAARCRWGFVLSPPPPLGRIWGANTTGRCAKPLFCCHRFLTRSENPGAPKEEGGGVGGAPFPATSELGGVKTRGGKGGRWGRENFVLI